MTTEQLINNIAAATGCTPEQIMGKSKKASVANARALLQYALRERGWHFARIGRAFNTDHSPALYNHRKVAKALALAESYKKAMTEIKP